MGRIDVISLILNTKRDAAVLRILALALASETEAFIDDRLRAQFRLIAAASIMLERRRPQGFDT